MYGERDRGKGRRGPLNFRIGDASLPKKSASEILNLLNYIKTNEISIAPYTVITSEALDTCV